MHLIRAALAALSCPTSILQPPFYVLTELAPNIYMLHAHVHVINMQLARQWHPDVNTEPGAEDKFKEISRAYEVCQVTRLIAQNDVHVHIAHLGALNLACATSRCMHARLRMMFFWICMQFMNSSATHRLSPCIMQLLSKAYNKQILTYTLPAHRINPSETNKNRAGAERS